MLILKNKTTSLTYCPLSKSMPQPWPVCSPQSLLQALRWKRMTKSDRKSHEESHLFAAKTALTRGQSNHVLHLKMFKNKKNLSLLFQCYHFYFEN